MDGRSLKEGKFQGNDFSFPIKWADACEFWMNRLAGRKCKTLYAKPKNFCRLDCIRGWAVRAAMLSFMWQKSCEPLRRKLRRECKKETSKEY